MIHFRHSRWMPGLTAFRMEFSGTPRSRTEIACCVGIEEELAAFDLKDRRPRQQDMASRLLCCLRNCSAWSADPTSSKGASVKVHKTRLGKPFLEIDGCQAPSISFSYHGERVWGAMCEFPYQCGIDVAAASEFDGRFPMKRVFLPKEIAAAAQITGREESAAALLWSSKEAVAKAVGCGFHLVEPIQICVESICDLDGLVSVEASVRLPPNPFLMQSPFRCVQAACFADRENWIAVAIGFA